MMFAVLTAPAASAQGLVAPVSKCKNANGFRHEAKARKSMICLTNWARHRKGLKRYKVNSRLTRSAATKASDVLDCNEFSHSACGRPFTFWMDKYRYTAKPGWSAGENIAWGSGSFGSSRAIFRAWLNSPGHRRAILSKEYVELGIGLDHGKLDNVTGARVWVQHFGRRN